MGERMYFDAWAALYIAVFWVVDPDVAMRMVGHKKHTGPIKYATILRDVWRREYGIHRNWKDAWAN